MRRARARRVAGLYALTPDIGDDDALLRSVDAAIDGGAALVQYRNKTADADARRRQAHALARRCAARNVLFLVNDDPEAADAVGADGVHLGEDDGAIEAARARIGPDRLIGVSCYDDLARAREAVAAGADYVAFGSFFPSTVKPGARHAHTDLLVRSRNIGVPVVAIGGITSKNAALPIAAGASAVAVIGDIFGHGDADGVKRAAAAIAACFRATP